MFSFECPVKPGQTVWKIDCRYADGHGWYYAVVPLIVTRISFMDGIDGYELYLFGHDNGYDNCMACAQDDWLQKIFPTREEAEKKLEDLIGGKL